MEQYNPNNPAYQPQDINANDLIMDAMRDIYRQDKLVRDF